MLKQANINAQRSEHQASGGDAPLFSTALVAERRRAEQWLADRLKRGEREIFSEENDLSPVLAELLLARNPDNRNVRDGVVSDYAGDIVEGNWTTNGESLKISRQGMLNDGQHRCLAVIKAGRKIRTMFTFGVERASRTTLDQGLARTPGDYLGMAGVSSANQAAAVATLLWQYKRLGRISRQSIYRPTKAQILEAFAEHSGINDSIRVAAKKGCNVAGGVSVLALCHYLFAQVDRAAADNFIEKLIKGTDLPASDPIYLCRERLRSETRMVIEDKAELIIRAWNNHRRGRRLQKLQLGVKEVRKPSSLPAVGA